MLLARLLRRMIRVGRLTLVDAHGRSHVFEGTPAKPVVTIRLRDPALHTRMFFNPMLVTGEAFMNGTLTIEDGDIYDFVELASINLGWDMPDHWVQRLLARIRHVSRRIAQYNPAPKAKANVAHHYDLSGELYRLFLDSDQQYSCAYFRDPGDDLESAQLQKKHHLAGKLLLQPGQRVLDIGCGWGGLALYLAQMDEVDVTGVTLSEEQHKVANQRAADLDLASRVHIEMQDYRAVGGQFDRIVSVGMFEHVGVGHYEEFFGKVADLLTDDGVAVVHTIGRADGPGATNPWIRKYIFPGGYCPALSEVSPVIERAGLYITDVEVLRLHYAETLRQWRERFNANRDKVRELYDERFCRMWELYLAGSECAFRYGGHVVFQIQMSKAVDAVPITRDYITDFDRKLKLPKAERDRNADSQAA